MSKKNAKGIVEAVETVSKVLGTTDPTKGDVSVISKLTSNEETAQIVTEMQKQEATPVPTTQNYVAKAAAKLRKRIESGEVPATITPASVQAASAEIDKAKKAEEKEAEKKRIAAEKEKAAAEKAAQKEKEKINILTPAPLAEMFPDEMFHEKLGKLKLNVTIDSIKAFRELVLQGKKFVFAFWWTRRHLKQFTYDAHLKAPTAGFPNDLDIAQPIFVADNDEVIYAVSNYTNRVYDLLPVSLVLLEDTNVRVHSGCEFAIYEVVTEVAAQ